MVPAVPSGDAVLVVEVVVEVVEAPHGRLPTCCRCRSGVACRPLTGPPATRRRQNTCFSQPRRCLEMPGR
ncbi:hypothetical protein E2C01_069239 [Portunus trituberculatus]|uniref:Uncharacterized protein n=1 Tax=Portunus trituberculatus TaxID=210409 RepID=A0A5B7HU13_PORTR|nr:hypothetical protein [Portunus trituberculatus]